MKNILIACFVIISANYFAQTKTSFPSKEFYTCWKASYEEDEEKTKMQVYRACSYDKFKPSMFRLDIEFFENGTCKYLHVGPTDNHYYVEGKWKADKKTKVVTVTDDKDQLAYKFKIKEVKKDIMKVISLN